MIFDCLFGLYIFSHQSCATGTLLLPKDIYPRKYCQIFTNLFFNAYLIVQYVRNSSKKITCIILWMSFRPSRILSPVIQRCWTSSQKTRPGSGTRSKSDATFFNFPKRVMPCGKALQSSSSRMILCKYSHFFFQTLNLSRCRLLAELRVQDCIVDYHASRVDALHACLAVCHLQYGFCGSAA